jgi:hypothetical protein
MLPTLVVLVGLLALVLALKRWISQHLQGVGMLLFGRPGAAFWLYLLVMLPGVLLHEVSHWLVARLLGLATGGLSIGPRQSANGRWQLGAIEIERSDPLRDSLVGLAPLVAGAAVVVAIPHVVFGLQMVGLAQAGSLSLPRAAAQVLTTPDSLLWLYLLFAVSNSMLPSPADRHSWGVLVIYIALLAGAAYAVFGLPSLPASLLDALARSLDALVLAFSLTATVDLLFVGLIAGTELAVGRLMGRTVEY